jgi:hypothetical protein
MKRVLMNDIMAPVEAFDLFPRKRFALPAWIKALFHRTPGARVAYARTAVAKY